MQMFSRGDNLHEMLKPVFWKKKKKKKKTSAELAKKVVRLNWIQVFRTFMYLQFFFFIWFILIFFMVSDFQSKNKIYIFSIWKQIVKINL